MLASRVQRGPWAQEAGQQEVRILGHDKMFEVLVLSVWTPRRYFLTGPHLVGRRPALKIDSAPDLEGWQEETTLC